MLLAEEKWPEFELDVYDNELQLVNVLFETVKLLLLTLVSPVNSIVFPL